MSSFVVADWLLGKPDADQPLGEGWMADIARQQYADEYQKTLDDHAGHLSGARLKRLQGSVLMAKQAVMEPSATVWNGQADIIGDGLDALADRLMAQEKGQTPTGAGAQITLAGVDAAPGPLRIPTPAPDWAGILPPLLVLGALGAGAYYMWGR